MHQLATQMKHDYMRRYPGRNFRVLVENDTEELNGEQVRFGYSPNYLRTAIKVSGASPCPNSIVTAQVREYDESSGTLAAEAGFSGGRGRPGAPLYPSQGFSACR